MKTIAGVSICFGTISMKPFKTAPSRPVRSAMPIPSMPTSTTPRGGNCMKLSTRLESSQKMPSLVSRLRAFSRSPLSRHSSTRSPSSSRFASWTISPSGPTTSTMTFCGSCGCTLQSVATATHERPITSSVPSRKSVAGSGSQLPIRSMASSSPDRGVWSMAGLRGSPDSGADILPALTRSRSYRTSRRRRTSASRFGRRPFP